MGKKMTEAEKAKHAEKVARQERTRAAVVEMFVDGLDNAAVLDALKARAKAEDLNVVSLRSIQDYRKTWGEERKPTEQPEQTERKQGSDVQAELLTEPPESPETTPTPQKGVSVEQPESPESKQGENAEPAPKAAEEAEAESLSELEEQAETIPPAEPRVQTEQEELSTHITEQRIREIFAEMVTKYNQSIPPIPSIIMDDVPPEPVNVRGGKGKPGRKLNREYRKVGVTIDANIWALIQNERKRLKVNDTRMIEILLWRALGRPALSFEEPTPDKPTE